MAAALIAARIVTLHVVRRIVQMIGSARTASDVMIAADRAVIAHVNTIVVRIADVHV